jgi:adhesin transport system outer membrane protein
MHKKLFTMSAISAILVSGAVWAQPASSLKDSVERAILNNPEIRLKYQNLLAITGEQDAAKGGWFPKIDLSADTGRKNSLAPGLGSAVDYDNTTTTLQLRQMLFDGFSTSSDVRRLGHSRLTSYYELLSASDQLALEVARAYIDVRRYRELVTLARDNYATHADVNGRLESRVKAGVGRRVDLEQAAGRMALAESNWLTETSNLHDVTTRYQRLVGEAPAETLQPPPNLTKLLPSRDNFVVNTVRGNPDFLGAVSIVRAYRADAQLRESPNYPSLEFRASQSLEKNRNGVNGDYRDSALQLVLNYNLYRGGSDSARIRQYAAKLNSAFDLRDKTCRDVRQTALIALNDVSKLEAQIGLLAQHELSTAVAREAYRQQFDLGQRSLLDLLDTENELYQARRALTNAEEDHQLSKARVLTVNGSLLPALQLRPIQSEAPPLPEGAEADDDALLCDTTLPAPLTLDKAALPPVSAPPLAVAPPVASPPAPDNSICQSITPTVEKWIAAWNKKDINGYFAAYSDAFVPALDLKRNQWETLRKKRVGKQGGISTVLKNITPTRCDSKTSEVSFTQEYGSDDYRDSVEKTLAMEYVNGQWKILRETVTKGRTF